MMKSISQLCEEMRGMEARPFGEGVSRKYWIHDLYVAARAFGDTCTAEQFKARLMAEMRTAKGWCLSRCDLPQCAPKGAPLAESEISYLGGLATFHLVTVEA